MTGSGSEPLDTAAIRDALAAGMSPMAGHGRLVYDLLDEIDRLQALNSELWRRTDA